MTTRHMRRLVTGTFLLAFLLGLAGSITYAAIKVGPVDYATYAPNSTFKTHAYYKSPYTDVIFVAAKVATHNGDEVLVIEKIRGTTCGVERVCFWPVNQPRGTWLEVQVTVVPDLPPEF